MPGWVGGLVQAVFGRLLYELLLAVGVASLIAYLKATKERWVGPVIYGLTAFALVLVIGYTITGRALLSTQQPQTTPENVEANIRSWLDDLGYSTRILLPPQAPANSIFYLETRYINGDPVNISYLREHNRYIVIHANLVTSPPDVLDKLSKEAVTEISQQVIIEMARTGVYYSLEPPLKILRFEKHVPITNLTEDGFVADVDEVHAALILARETIILGVERAKRQGLAAQLAPYIQGSRRQSAS